MFKCSGTKPWEVRKQMIIVILRDVSIMSYLSTALCQGGEM